MSEKITFSIEILGTEKEISQLNIIANKIQTLADKQKVLKITGKENTDEFRKQAIELKETRKAYRQVENSIERNNKLQVESKNTLRSVSSQLSILREKLKDVEIGGKAYTKITGDIKKLEKAQRDANVAMGRGSSFVGEYARGFQQGFAKMAISITAITVGLRTINRLFGGATQAYLTQQKAEAKVKQAIISTNQAAGKSFDELKEKAVSLQKDTLFGDEEILNKVTAQLLTFTNIANDEFDRTQKVALDLATVLDGDLQSASIQLGKALNDPIANLSALSRAGIQFSTDQKATIKTLVETNRLADAQNVILTELERQYGGQAEAAAKADGGITQFSNKIGDLKENIGGLLIDALQPFIKGLGWVVDAMNDWFEESDKIAAAQEKFVRNIDDETFELNRLFDAISKTTAGTEERKIAVEELNTAYPNLHYNMNLELANENDINKARKEAIILIRSKAAEEVKASEISRITGERLGEVKEIHQEILDDLELEPRRRAAAARALQEYSNILANLRTRFEDGSLSQEQYGRQFKQQTDALGKVVPLTEDYALKLVVAASNVKSMNEEIEQTNDYYDYYINEAGDIVSMTNNITAATTNNTKSQKDLNTELKKQSDLYAEIKKQIIELQATLSDNSSKELEQLKIDEEERLKVLEDALNFELEMTDEYRNENEAKDQEQYENDVKNYRKAQGEKRRDAEAFWKFVNEAAKLSNEVIGNFRDAELMKIQQNLDQGVISEEEAAEKKKEIQKKYALFELITTMAKIVTDTRAAVMTIWKTFGANPVLAGILSAVATAKGISELTRAKAEYNTVSKLAYGGVIEGRSHAAGGVQGTGNIETQGGEAVINTRSTRLFAPVLSAINEYNGFGKPLKAATGMILPPSSPIGSSSANMGLMGGVDMDKFAQMIINGYNDKQVFVTEKDISDKQLRVNKIQTKVTF